jgi:glycosyltransferase involved in cell wall biosynthesis
VQRRDLFVLHFNPSILIELQRGQFDVIVVSGINHPTMQLAILYALATRTPYLLWNESHHVRARPRSWFVRFLKAAIYRPLFSRAAGCLVTGSYARQYFISYGGRSDRTFVVANTVDVHTFARKVEEAKSSREILKQEISIACNKRVILYVGRLVGVKGLHYLIAAFAKVHKVREDTALVLVGDGPLRVDLEKLVHQLGLKDVVFVGFKQPDELPLYYALGDVFVLPSIDEPWGTVVNEAMAAGLPIVTTRVVGAAGDLVRHGENGYIVPEADSQALAEALIDILDDETRRQCMGQRSQEIIAPWTYENSAHAFIKAVQVAYNDRRALAANC